MNNGASSAQLPKEMRLLITIPIFEVTTVLVADDEENVMMNCAIVPTTVL